MGGISPRLGKRIAAGAGAVVLADLIVGMAAFSIISLGALWYFCLGWIRLAAEFGAVGLPFGAAWQLALAWLGAIGAPALLVLTIFLSRAALRLPFHVYRAGRDGVRPRLRAGLISRGLLHAIGLFPKR